jgi:hypothetical protein
MIYADSRYSKGTIIKAQDARTDTYRLGVYRNFPTGKSKFYTYTWVEGDRIDLVAAALLGNSTYWWKIMDFNPEIVNPFTIRVGSTIRIPSV